MGGFETATRAAAAGGVITIASMPLNSIPPTTTVEALKAKLAAATGKCFVDVGFWGGAVPTNLGSLHSLLDAGVFGFKCFLVPSGVDEFPPLGERQLRRSTEELVWTDAPLLVHAELPGRIEAATRELAGEDRRAYETYQGWDLHPAQLPSRFATVYAFLLDGMEDTVARLRAWRERTAAPGGLLDEPATVRALLARVRRAVECGAVTEEEVLGETGLRAGELRTS